MLIWSLLSLVLFCITATTAIHLPTTSLSSHRLSSLSTTHKELRRAKLPANLQRSEADVVADATGLVIPTPQLFFQNIIRNIRQFESGFRQLILDIKNVMNIKKMYKKQSSSISFEDFCLMQRHNDDMGKFARIAFTGLISREWLFYTYFLFPMISMMDVPQTWKAFPSTFLSNANKEKLIATRQQYQLQSIWYTLYCLKNEMISNPTIRTREQLQSSLQTIMQAVKVVTSNPSNSAKDVASNGLEDAMKTLEPFYTTIQPIQSVQNKKTLIAMKEKLELKHIPHAVLKEVARAVGVADPAWNVPVIRSANRNEVLKYFNRLRESDNYLLGLQQSRSSTSSKSSSGVANALNEKELRMACLER